MRIKSLGARYILSQVDRIEDGFKLLGHELVEENPDIIYVNDAGYHKEGTELKKKYPTAKLILNTLDLPWHCREINEILNKLNVSFYYADAITTISSIVGVQILNTFTNTQKNGVSVIYQPAKPVSCLNLERRDRFLFVGRACDPNKRFNVGLELAGLSNRIIDVVGPEDPTEISRPQYRKFINYLGLVSDEQLNKEYNTHFATLVTGKIEGLSLSLIESLITKTPVICCEDMATANELCPKEFISRTNLYDMSEKVRFIASGHPSIKKALDEYSEKYKEQFSNKSVANNIIEIYGKIKDKP